MAVSAGLRIVRFQQRGTRSDVRIMTLGAAFRLHWRMSFVAVFFERIVTAGTDSAFVIDQCKGFFGIGGRVAIRTGRAFEGGVNRFGKERLGVGRVRDMALRTIFTTDGIARVLCGERGIVFAVTARA